MSTDKSSGCLPRFLAVANRGRQVIGGNYFLAGYSRRKPSGRDALDTANPEVPIELILEEVKRLGLDAFEQIGVEETRVVEHRKSSLVVLVIRRPKFKAKTEAAIAALPPWAAETAETGNDIEPGARIVASAAPELPIVRGLAGPRLLADSIVKRLQRGAYTRRCCCH